MDPAQLIPTPDTIPAPWGFFEFFLILTFFAHLLFMNAMLGTAIIAMLREMRTPSTAPPPCQDIANKLPYTIAFAVNFGVAPLLFLQVLYGHFIYTSSILMGVYWLSIIGLLILAYYSAYLYKMASGLPSASRKRTLGTSILLLLITAFLFVNNITLMQTPQSWEVYFHRPDGTFLNLAEPTLLPRYLHFVVASVATGGLFLAILAFFQGKKDPAGATKRLSTGMKWFTYATVVEIGTGIPFLFSMPKNVHQLFVGGALLPTLLFIASLVAAGFCLYYGTKERVWPATVAMAATILFMVLVRDLARQAYLAPYFHPADLQVVPQWSPMYLFLAILVIGVAVIIYMLKLAARVPEEVR
ncbi:hypothetical protein [Thiovibrio frasassiensis]|uniref:Uncharacterized protein n=1 Tax=Thiovibrio frasassiensis TaxID=2984131 RepID=A0A9X4RPC8_9BACT|nr:hypothetical protein [Thiovibrio frasassiensis]MDG4475117.1 hypothetical protein [Thiovibrio frasassiensis]